MPAPLAYFITFTTYGTWLHGRDPGSVDRQHNTPGTSFLPVNPEHEHSRCDLMRQERYTLDEPRRALVLNTIQEVAAHRGWRLWAVHVRTTHVHIVVTAHPKPLRAGSVSDGFSPPGTTGTKHSTQPNPEKVMNDFKTWNSRRLREVFNEQADRDRWTQHGSTRWLNTHDSLLSAIQYVIDEQGEPMACFDGRIQPPNYAAQPLRAGSGNDA